MVHQSVLLKEVIDGLNLEPGDTYLDATLGSGFHLIEVSRRMKNTVTLAGIDVDQMSIEVAKANLDLAGVSAKIARMNFRNIDQARQVLDIGLPNKILFDLGWNAPQFDQGGRGFSFQKEEPLLMNLSSEEGEMVFNAYDVVNNWEEENLASIIYGYGEEKYSRRIAKAIVEARNRGPIKTSTELAEIVKQAVPFFYRFGRIHPATKTFQAIRIAVNDELRALEEALEKSFELIPKEGRIAIISFHSLEDRIVKNFFRRKAELELGRLFNKKPIIPSREEIIRNKRSRSAKLRIIIKK